MSFHLVCCLLLARQFLGLLFDPEDGSNLFLPNVGKLLSDYTATHLRSPLISTAVGTSNPTHVYASEKESGLLIQSLTINQVILQIITYS
jgi:hypothetical protein